MRQICKRCEICPSKVAYHTLYTTVLYLHADIPDQPQNLSVKFDDSSESLNITITWSPPENSRQFDLEEYIFNITSTSGLDISERVPAGTTTWIFTNEREQFTATVTAINKCGQTGSTASETWKYTPSKHCTDKTAYSYCTTILVQN